MNLAKVFTKISLKKTGFLLGLVLILGLGLFLPTTASANFGSWLGQNLILPLAEFIGGLTVTLIGILIGIVQYNDFINAPAVAKGWVIIRDLANMFVIVVMLVIAFATVFRIEEYQYKKLLSKLLIMSVLVNFSKMLTGFFIDFAQVVMLTFVNGFKEAAAGNFVNGFHLSEMFEFSKSKTIEGATSNENSFFVASILALISITVAMVVVAVYLVVFLVRIAFLWLLTILSPLAFLLAAFPGQAKKYSSEWWEYFGKYLSAGPILAFFLWLALSMMQTSNNALDSFVGQSGSDYSFKDVPGVAITGIGQSEILLSFIINIVILLGGLWMTQKLGVAGGKLAGSALAKMQSIGSAPFRGAAHLFGKGAKTASLWGLRRADDMQAGLQQRFMARTTIGKRIAESKFGEKYGLNKLAEHGIQFRTIPHAWHERTKRIEMERLGSSAGVAGDIISRAWSFGKDRPTESLEMKGRQIAEQEKNFSAVSENKEHLINELKEATEEYTTKDGRKVRRFKLGKDVAAEALLRMLTKGHDINEVFKDPNLGLDYDYIHDTGGKIVQFTKDLFGGGDGTQEAARVMMKLGDIGLANSDGALYGNAGIDAHGKFVFFDYVEDEAKGMVKRKEATSIEDAKTKMRLKKMSERRQDISHFKNLFAYQHGDRVEDDSWHTYQELEASIAGAINSNNEPERKRLEKIKSDVDKMIKKKERDIGGLFSDGDVLSDTEIQSGLDEQIQREIQGKIAAIYIAKRAGRNIANQARFQDFFVEVADGDGNRYAGGLSESGIANIAQNGSTFATHWRFSQEELKKYMRENLDLIVQQYEKDFDKLKPQERINYQRFISSVVKGGDVLDDSALAKREEIINFLKTHPPDRLSTVTTINKTRKEKGVPEVPGMTLGDVAPIQLPSENRPGRILYATPASRGDSGKTPTQPENQTIQNQKTPIIKSVNEYEDISKYQK